jgi:hypothetical protein
MKYLKVALFIVSLSAICALTSCFELFPDETVFYEGRVYEAFDKSKPVDSVLVQGCTQKLSLFPNWPSCDTETLTNSEGYFFIVFEADGLEGRAIFCSKEGYKSLDSCITLNDGTLECFIEPLPTVFYIYSPTYTESLTYDSLKIFIQAEDLDTTVFYHTESFENTWGGTSFYWTTDTDLTFGSLESFTNIFVPDNSVVILTAQYFNNDEFIITDLDTLFCRKGVGNSYKILN